MRESWAWTRSVISRDVRRKDAADRVGFGKVPLGRCSMGFVTWQTPVMMRPIPPAARRT